MKRGEWKALAVMVAGLALILTVCFLASCRRVRKEIIRDTEDRLIDKAQDTLDKMIEPAPK